MSAGCVLVPPPRPPALFCVVGVPSFLSREAKTRAGEAWRGPEAWSDRHTSALAPTGDPCPGRLYTPSRLPGPCWAVGRQSLARPAWPCVRRPVGTFRTAWPLHQPAAPLTR